MKILYSHAPISYLCGSKNYSLDVDTFLDDYLQEQIDNVFLAITSNEAIDSFICSSEKNPYILYGNGLIIVLSLFLNNKLAVKGIFGKSKPVYYKDLSSDQQEKILSYEINLYKCMPSIFEKIIASIKKEFDIPFLNDETTVSIEDFEVLVPYAQLA